MLNPYERKDAVAICLYAYCSKVGETRVFTGGCWGKILERPRGESNFGWDPIFVPNEDNPDKLTFAEMDPEMKNSFSHRALAM